jgi:hypothetical protein
MPVPGSVVENGAQGRPTTAAVDLAVQRRLGHEAWTTPDLGLRYEIIAVGPTNASSPDEDKGTTEKTVDN